MGLICKHWAAQERSGFTRSICSDCPKRSEILANRQAARTSVAKPTIRTATPTSANARIWSTGDAFASPAQLAERKQRVEADLEALRSELASGPVRTVGPPTTPEPAETPAPAVRNPYRPSTLDTMVGQHQVIQQLRIVLHGGRLRGDPIPHILLTGPPGFGKSSLASIIAEEIEASLVTTTGMMLKKPDDLVALLLQQTGPTVLFLDEVHRLPIRVQESLFTVMEDGTLDVVGAGETTRHHLPELVVVAATTASGLLAEPFRARFGAQFIMTAYTDDEIATIAGHVWETKETPYAPGEAIELAIRSRGIPRRAVTLAERVLDVVAVKGSDKIGPGDVASALALFGIDANGLDETDYKILSALTKTYAGRPVGLAALAQLLDMEESTIAENHEGYLVRRGFVIRTRAGRLATRAAYELMQESPQPS